MSYFKINLFEITPRPEAKFNITPFHIKASSEVVDLTEPDKKDVSFHFVKAMTNMNVYTPLEAIKELVILLVKFDTTCKINWPDTLHYLRVRMKMLHYKTDYTELFLEDLKSVLPIVESVSK